MGLIRNSSATVEIGGAATVEEVGKRARVLVVEDDADLRDLLSELLARQRYDVTVATDGEEALRALFDVRPHLVVLDLVLPRLDGWAVLERIREMSDVPVLILTALTTELEKVRGLRAGADDYLTKPFGHGEFVARVEALLRRAPAAGVHGDTYDDGSIALDHAAREVRAHGRSVSLTPLEYRLLRAFLTSPDEVLSHERLLEDAWGTARGGSSDQVRLYVNYLRAKLGPPAAERIETVRGFGYRYRSPRG